MFKGDSTIQPQLFANTPRDLLPDDCDVFLYIDLFSSLDLEDFYYKYSAQGQDSLDPRLMLQTIFYGLTHGISTGRKLEAAVRFDARYMVLCGGHLPCYRSFHRFLNRHASQIEDLFVKIVKLAQAMGLVSLGNLAIDGTRLKGNTSRHRTLRYEKLSNAIIAIKQELSQLRKQMELENHAEKNDVSASIPTEIKAREKRLANIEKAKRRLEEEAKTASRKPNPKTQISVNDPDARSLPSNKESYVVGYNGQAVVDGKSQIIVGADIEDSANDRNALAPMLKQSLETCLGSPENILADSGYYSADNVASVEALGSYPSIAFQKMDICERVEHVTVTEDGKGYQCLKGYRLKCYSNGYKSAVKAGWKITIDKEKCSTCDLRGQCKLYAKSSGEMQLPLPEKREKILRHLERARSARFKEVYKLRKGIVEPVFANIKVQKNLKIAVIGRSKVKTWWKMVCTAHNIEKIIRARIGASLESLCFLILRHRYL